MTGPEAWRARVRIATLYRRTPMRRLPLADMSTIRWVRISEALARLGYRVDLVADVARPPAAPPNLRYVPYAEARWDRYDVVKTLFHSGFEGAEAAGLAGHPFLISKLGSVVGPRDDTPGVYFFGAHRRQLWATQERIARTSRFVVLLTEASRGLWTRELGGRDRVVLVPTGVDAEVPAPGPDPFAGLEGPVAVYLGNLYDAVKQAEVNGLWQERLNGLGAALRRRGVRLCFAGPGDTDRIDPRLVTCLGPVHGERIWDHHHHAHVGIALAQGAVQHNESSKIYYYLRAGLPTVAERPIPNSGLVEETGLGHVAEYGREKEELAELVADAARRPWPRKAAVAHVLRHHTWDARARIYDRLLARHFGPEARTAPRAGDASAA